VDAEGPVPGQGHAAGRQRLLWQELIGALPDYAWLKSPDGRYLDCNDTFARHFGSTREGIRGLADADITDPATAADFIASDLLALALPAGQALLREEEMLRRDGGHETVALFKQVLRGAGGEPLAILGLSREVGEARRAQHLRDEYAQRLTLALECAGLAQWEVDLVSGAVSSIDPRLAAMLGIAPDSTLPTMEGFEARIHPDDRAQRVALRRDYLAGRIDRYECEYRVQHADGHWVWLLARAMVVERAPDGTPLRMVGTHLDISWRKQAEAGAQAAATAIQLAQAQAELLSRMSHELRTPLNAVIGFTQLMRMAQAQGKPPRADYLALVEDSARQLLTLIEDALQLRAVATRRPALVPREISLHAAVAEALELVSPLAADKGVVLSNELPPTLSCSADAAALRQVLVNLCSNAIRFNRAAGTVQLHAEVVTRGSGQRVLLHVQDSGEGLEAAQLERLFQPFERLGRLPGADAGSGLGLLIARELARAMGGDVRIESRRGMGTRATLELPTTPAD